MQQLMVCLKMRIDMTRVCVCNKFGISVYLIISQRVSPLLNGKVFSLGIDSKREEHAHLVRFLDQQSSVYFGY